jgi:hypothetical protein
MNIKWITWQDLPKGILKSFSKAFSEYKSNELISNVHTEYRILKVADDIFFPVTINYSEWNSSFVCSPYTAYALYSKFEVRQKIKNKLIQFPILVIIKLLGIWLKYGQINKNIHVNNFLLSTNPYPEWHGKEIAEITGFLKTEFPDHAIIFRSLNRYQHQNLLNIFENKKYKLIGSRQVYIYDLSYEEWLKHRNNKHDLKLIDKQKLIFLNHDEMESFLDQAHKLYQKLYLEKYSEYNPQFTLNYFEKCHREGIVRFQGYKNDKNELKAFSGLFIIEKTITSPLVGYDTSASHKEGLYIHAAQLAIQYKFQSNLLLNLSSGASQFKRMRGGKPSIEYSAIYFEHLSFKRKFILNILKFLSNKIGIPLMEKYEL